MVSQVSRFFNQDYAPLYYAVQKEQTRLASDHEVRCVLEALRRGFDQSQDPSSSASLSSLGGALLLNRLGQPSQLLSKPPLSRKLSPCGRGRQKYRPQEDRLVRKCWNTNSGCNSSNFSPSLRFRSGATESAPEQRGILSQERLHCDCEGHEVRQPSFGLIPGREVTSRLSSIQP